MFEPLTSQSMIVTLLVLLALSIVADVRARRVPNRIVIIGLVVGLWGNASVPGAGGLAIALGGAVVGLLCLLPFHISGGMGAGDVKLMAMCGAFLGPVHVAVAAALSLVIGGVIGVACFVGQAAPRSRDMADTERPPAGTGTVAEGPTSLHSIPYAIAIAAGVVVTLVAMPAISNAL